VPPAGAPGSAPSTTAAHKRPRGEETPAEDTTGALTLPGAEVGAAPPTTPAPATAAEVPQSARSRPDSQASGYNFDDSEWDTSSDAAGYDVLAWHLPDLGHVSGKTPFLTRVEDVVYKVLNNAVDSAIDLTPPQKERAIVSATRLDMKMQGGRATSAVCVTFSSTAPDDVAALFSSMGQLVASAYGPDKPPLKIEWEDGTEPKVAYLRCKPLVSFAAEIAGDDRTAIKPFPLTLAIPSIIAAKNDVIQAAYEKILLNVCGTIERRTINEKRGSTKYNGSVTYIFDLNKNPKNPGAAPTHMRSLPMFALTPADKPRRIGTLEFANRNHIRISGYKIQTCCGAIGDDHLATCFVFDRPPMAWPLPGEAWPLPGEAGSSIPRGPSPTYSSFSEPASEPPGKGKGGKGGKGKGEGKGTGHMPPPPPPPPGPWLRQHACGLIPPRARTKDTPPTPLRPTGPATTMPL